MSAEDEDVQAGAVVRGSADDLAVRSGEVNGIFERVKALVTERLPEGPEYGRQRALVMTKIDEARLWALDALTLALMAAGGPPSEGGVR